MVDWKNHEFPISINERLINKNELNDKSANSDGFVAKFLTAGELLTFIKTGFAYSAIFDGGRKKQNFVQSGVISLDFDHGVDMRSVENDPLIKEAATIIYSTHSHTKENPRFRVIFVLETPIKNANELKAVTRSLALRLGSDPAATDAARQFFGNNKCQSIIRPFGLSHDRTNELIAQSLNAENDKNKSKSKSKSTSRSSLHFSIDQHVTTSDNTVELLTDLKKSTSIYCPFHNDKSPSAFTILSQSGIVGIHCSTCDTSYWPEDEIFDFGTFDQAIRDSVSSVERFDPFEPFYETTKNPVYPILDGTGEDKPASVLPNIEIMDYEFLPDLQLVQGKNYIKSPKGSGKTQFLSRLVRDNSISVLLIGHRRSLIRQLCERLDLECYLDNNKGRKRYGVCLDSLTKVRDETIYDYILIDESEQVLAHILSETMIGKRNSVLLRLCRLIENSKNIVALDADLSWPTFRFFSRFPQFNKSSNRSAIFHNNVISNHPKINIFDSKSHLIEKIFQSIKNGERCFVTSNSKKLIDKLHASIEDMFPAMPLIKITSDNSNQTKIQSFLSNIQEEALKYRVILTTPSVSTGIDISFENNEQQIDQVFGIFEPLVTTHFECDQQLSRVRNPKATSVFISPARFSFETNLDVISQDLQVGLLNEELIDGYDSKGKIKYRIEDPLLYLGCSLVSIQRASKNNLKKHFIDHKTSQGFEIEIVASDATSVSKGSALLSNGKNIFDKKYRQQLLNSDRLKKYEYLMIQESLDDNTSINDTSLASFHRTSIELFYRQPISVELIKLDDRGSFRSKVRLFNQLANKETVARDTRSAESIEFRKQWSSVIPSIGDTVSFLRDSFVSAAIFSEGNFIRDVEITSKSLSNFSKFMLGNKPQFETVFGTPMRQDIKLKPVTQLGYLLKKVGLTTKALPARYEGKKKIYSYKIDSEKLDQMLEFQKMINSSEDLWTKSKADS